MEAYGAMGKEFLEHINHIANHAAVHNSYIALGPSPTALKRRFTAEISAALMKGNANIRLKATQQCLAYTKHTTHQAKSNMSSLYLSSFSPFPILLISRLTADRYDFLFLSAVGGPGAHLNTGGFFKLILRHF